MSHFSGNDNVWPCVLGGVAAGACLGFALARTLKTKKRPSNLTLSYFDGRGLAETARQMLAVAGVDYTDKRYGLSLAEGEGSVFSRIQKPEMDADQAKGLFDANLGRLPILEADGERIGGSKAIYRFIANNYELMGSTSAEAGQIDCICEIMQDIVDAFGKQDDKDKWFNTTSAEGFKQGERQLQWYLEKLDKLVGSNGFAVGTTFSMADAIIYSKFGERCTTKGLFGNPDSQPMGDAARTEAALKKCAPNLAKVVDNWRNCPAIKSYLANRGEQWF